jgi:hypothetical protein
MHRSYPSENPVRRWRQFCRKGWRMAWGFAALWFGLLALLCRVAPAPEPALREAPAKVSWWLPQGGAAENSVAMDVRALWTPSAFALSSPVGFSHSLRRERAGLTPPVQTARPAVAFLENPGPVPALDLAKRGHRRLAASETQAEFLVSASVFPPRVPEREEPRLSFPDGWESRLFSGIDLNFGAWTNSAWSARVEMRFDAKGVPVSMMLAQASGIPELDSRLARSVSGWRLLEPSAARTGVVAWSCPGAESPVPVVAPPVVAAGRRAP